MKPVVRPPRNDVSSINVMSVTSLLLRLAVGSVLCYAGFLKAVAPSAEFAAAIEAYHLLPPFMLDPMAFALPWIEMWVGIFLVAGFMTREAAIAASVLFVLFLGVILSALTRGIDLASCGCFGSDVFSPRHTLVVDSFLLIFSLSLVFLKPSKELYALES